MTHHIENTGFFPTQNKTYMHWILGPKCKIVSFQMLESA